jgi:hypothetical protein
MPLMEGLRIAFGVSCKKRIKMKQPNITINYIPLDIGQIMTIHVALESFACELEEKGLGDDDSGKRISEGYLQRIDELRKLMGAI